MNKKVWKKLISVFCALCMLTALVPAVMAEGNPVAIQLVTTDEGGNYTGADVTVSESGNYTLYGAVYSGNSLVNVEAASFTESGVVTFDEPISVNPQTQTFRLYVWDDEQKPVYDIIEEQATGFTTTFDTDAGVSSVDVYYTQDYTAADETNVFKTKVRDADTGEIATDGNGQINFKVNLENGYEISGITVTKGTYKNLKKVEADTYRVTKITTDTKITITTAPSSELETNALTADFVTDAGVESITVSETDSFDIEALITENATSATVRDGDGGYILSDGNGQINFVVKLANGYQITSVTATDGTYKNLKPPAETGVTNGYRLTKVTANTTITIATEAIPEETGDDVIHLADNNIVALSSEGGTITNVSVDNTNNIVRITPSATGETYTLTGSLTDGQIVVAAANKKYETTLVLDGVSVACSTGSALYVTEGKTIIDTNNTASAFTSTATEYASDGTTAQETAAINTKRDTTIQGGGTLTANSTNGNAIHCKKDLTIGEANLTANGGNNGIKGKQSVTITEDAGTITVTAVKDGICSDYAPEIDTTTNTVTASLTDMGTDAGGTVTINGGTVNVTTTGTTKTGDGIQADALLTVNGGNITVNATGEALKANCSQLDYADAADYSTYATALASYNGCIVINGGQVNATAGEDGIKATKDITITGGSTTVTKAGGDGIQAGDVVSTVSGTSVSFAKIDGTVAISGDSTVVKVVDAADDGITATYKYNQTAGDVGIKSTYDGIQAGKAYTSYEITGSSTYDDDTNIYETNGIVDISGGTLDIYTYNGGETDISAGDSNNTLANIDSCKGIKARKLINISGGTINIASEDDSIHSDHTVNISNGDITVKSCDDGVHGEYFLNISGGSVNVTKSYEGIEASEINITGGNTYVVAKDDGANGAGDNPSSLSSEKTAYTLKTVTDYEPSSTATLQTASSSSGSSSSGSSGGPGGQGGPSGSQRPGSQGGPADMGNDNSADYGYIEITDGLLYIEAEGDGFDSNGNALISGGTVLVNGPSSGGNGILDVGEGSTLTVTGGMVIGAGINEMALTSQSGTMGYYIYNTVTSQSAGQVFRVTNSNGDEIVTYRPSKAYSRIFVYTGAAGSYTVTKGTVSDGTYKGSYDGQYGILTSGTFTAGSSIGTLTAANAVLGENAQGGGPGGR